jgi:biotin synthase
MIREIKALGLETCVTLGMFNADQAYCWKKGGLAT